MNQILDYSPNKGGKKSSGSDKIVHFFAIVMILFAVVIIAVAGYNLYQNNKIDNPVENQEEKASIEVIKEETQAIIKVTHTKAIEKIIYSWNNGKESTIKTTGESSVQESIPLPAGENTLHIKVIDINGGESTYEGEFASESGSDILNPVIKLEITDDKKLKITATDETSLDFITYRWNDGEEKQVNATEENPKEIEVEIEILKGKNDITISAVDSNNNTTTEVKSLNGLTKPEVKIVVAPDKQSVDVTIKHENGLKEIKLKLNDTEYPVPVEENQRDIMFNVKLSEGTNKLEITAISVDDTKTEAVEEVENIPQIGGEEDIQITIEKTEDGQAVHYVATHSSGIKELKLNINDMDLDLSALNEQVSQNPTTIEFLVPLFDGNNKITFTVVPVTGEEKQEIKEIVK